MCLYRVLGVTLKSLYGHFQPHCPVQGALVFLCSPPAAKDGGRTCFRSEEDGLTQQQPFCFTAVHTLVHHHNHSNPHWNTEQMLNKIVIQLQAICNALTSCPTSFFFFFFFFYWKENKIDLTWPCFKNKWSQTFLSLTPLMPQTVKIASCLKVDQHRAYDLCVGWTGKLLKV